MESSIDKMDLILLAIYSYNLSGIRATEDDITSLLAIFQNISNKKIFHFILQGDNVISLDISTIINFLHTHGYVSNDDGLVLTERGYYLVQRISKMLPKVFYKISALSRLSDTSLKLIALSILRSKEKGIRELSEEEKLAINLLNAFKTRII